MEYVATKPILYMADGRSWDAGDQIPLHSVSPGVAQAWLDDGIVVEKTAEKPKRGRPRKEVKDDSTDST